MLIDENISRRRSNRFILSLVTIFFLGSMIPAPHKGGYEIPAGVSFIDHPFDIVVQGNDDNGIPLNPIWKSQTAGALPDCQGGKLIPYKQPLTSQSPFIDDSWKCPTAFISGPLGGHADWTPATYTGTIFWGDHSSDDDDYNMTLIPKDLAGCTASNPSGINCEFDSDETIDHFHTHWWNLLHDAVDNNSANAHAMVDNREAIVIGALGLDCAHDCGSELHPVWAMAIHSKSGDPADDIWSIYVRNWGDQGYCSSHNITLPLRSITFRLPMANATAVSVNWDPQCKVNSSGNGTCFLCRGQGAGPFVTLLPNAGALVTFSLPDPSAGERINGELHLTWKVTKFNPVKLIVNRPLIKATEDNSIREKMSKMTAVQKSEYMKNIRPKPITFDQVVPARSLSPEAVNQLRRPPVVRPQIRLLTIDAAKDREKANKVELIKRIKPSGK